MDKEDIFEGIQVAAICLILVAFMIFVLLEAK